MTFRHHRCGRLLAAGLLLVGLAGCVERRMVIITDPPTAVVFDEKHQPLGAAPVDRGFTYYGKYRFYLVKDGYETMLVEENVRPPFYEYFLLDFVSENIIPFNLRDVRYFRYTLQPAKVVPPEAVLKQAQDLRERGKTIGVPLPQTPGTPPAPPPALLAPGAPMPPPEQAPPALPPRVMPGP